MFYAIHKLARAYESRAEARSVAAKKFDYGSPDYLVHMTASYIYQGTATQLRELLKAELPAQVEKLSSGAYDETY